MINAVITGKLYNVKEHGWTDKNEKERSMIRSRINYYNQGTGNYEWADAVCFRDGGESGGLVGWLADNYILGDDSTGGKPIVLTGYFRPVEKKHTVTLKKKLTGGGSKNIEVPNVPYPTFEFVIDSASFQDVEKGGSKSKGETPELEDDEDFDDIEVAGDEEESADEDEIVDETPEPEPTTPKGKGKKQNQSAQSKQQSGKDKGNGKGKGKEKKDEESDFFDDGATA